MASQSSGIFGDVPHDSEAQFRTRVTRTVSIARATNAPLMAEPPVTAETLAPERPFMALPLHIVADILSSLGDVQHLPSALLTHPIFHAAYKDFPTLATDALRQQISDSEVYALALIAYESDPARRARQGHTVTSFLASYKKDPAQLISQHRYVKLYEALRMGEFHDNIVKLRDSFADRTLRRLHGIEDLTTELPAHVKKMSEHELKRIERALYRYQIYCNLFSEQFRRGQDETELKRFFFDKHSMWANEQLGIIHDFLESELQFVIDQVALKNVERAEWLLEGAKGKKKQHFLSLGLAWLHQLITALSSDTQFDLLYNAKDFDGSIDKIAPAVPPTPWKEQNKGKEKAGAGLEWFKAMNKACYDRDEEFGPETLWKDLHGVKTDTALIVEHGYALRRLGYLMWDESRTSAEPCHQLIKTARQDSTPTILSSSRFMNPALAWDPRFRPRRSAASGRREGGGGARAFAPRRVGAARAAPTPKSKLAKDAAATTAAPTAEVETVAATPRTLPAIVVPTLNLGLQAIAGPSASLSAPVS